MTRFRERFGPRLRSLAIAAPLAIAVAPLQARAAATIAGIWLGQAHDGQVEIKSCGAAKMCGFIISILDRSLPPNPRDARNEDRALRARPVCGLEVLGDLTQQGEYWEGWGYDPRRGKTFQVEVRLQADNTLMVHGYLGIKILGKTELWTRTKNPIHRCLPPRH